jgi:hypothetical protein
VLTASSFGVLVTTPFVAAPWIGPAAIPAAMIVSAFAFNPIAAARVWDMFAIRTIHLRDAALIAVAAVMLAAYALAGSSLVGPATCGILALIGVHYTVSALRGSHTEIIPSA